MHATFCLSTQPNATQLRYSQLASPTCITIIRDGQLIMDKTYGFGAKGRRVESMSAGKTITAAVMGVVRLRTLMNKLLSSLGCPPPFFFFFLLSYAKALLAPRTTPPSCSPAARAYNHVSQLEAERMQPV